MRTMAARSAAAGMLSRRSVLRQYKFTMVNCQFSACTAVAARVPQHAQLPAQLQVEDRDLLNLVLSTKFVQDVPVPRYLGTIIILVLVCNSLWPAQGSR